MSVIFDTVIFIQSKCRSQNEVMTDCMNLVELICLWDCTMTLLTNTHSVQTFFW